MDYVSCAVALFALSLLGIQLFPVKNGLSMYNRDLQLLHAPMKNCDLFFFGRNTRNTDAQLSVTLKYSGFIVSDD